MLFLCARYHHRAVQKVGQASTVTHAVLMAGPAAAGAAMDCCGASCMLYALSPGIPSSLYKPVMEHIYLYSRSISIKNQSLPWAPASMPLVWSCQDLVLPWLQASTKTPMEKPSRGEGLLQSHLSPCVPTEALGILSCSPKVQ